MILLFTDFGPNGPYVGQVKVVLARAVPHITVVDVFSDLPAFHIQAAAYLLPAYSAQAQAGDVVLAVVDPGVGTKRRCVALQADGVWYVGPDNGLFAMIARRANICAAWVLDVPASASATFHGRDIFAPAAASLVLGDMPSTQNIDPKTLDRHVWPDDLSAVTYVDHYGNVLTGLRAYAHKPQPKMTINGHALPCYRTYADAPPGEPFMYANSNGLWEIAVNGGHAAIALGLKVGTPLAVEG